MDLDGKANPEPPEHLADKEQTFSQKVAETVFNSFIFLQLTSVFGDISLYERP